MPRGAWIENRPSRGWGRIDLDELWRYRELIVFLARRDLTVRYKQAAFGALWSVLQPLAGALTFTFVFRRLADVPSDGIDYPVFAYLGFMAWAYVTSGITSATESLVTNINLVTKVYFPRIAAPIAALLPGLVDLAVSSVALAAFMVVFGVAPGPQLVFAPLFVVALVAIVFGVGLVLATLHVKYRDARHATGLLLQLWLFVSPIAYPASLVSDTWREVYALNPVVGAVGGLRWAVLDGPFPGNDLLFGGITTAVLVGAGIVTFARAERRFADVI